MSYTTDFYKQGEDKKITYLFSVQGSNAPWYFEDAKTLEEVNEIVRDLQEDGVKVWFIWPNPWEDSRTSDDAVIFEIIKPKWWQFLKPKDIIKFWKDTHYQMYEEFKDTTKMYFSDIPQSEHTSNYGEDEHWQLDHLRIFELPQMRNKNY